MDDLIAASIQTEYSRRELPWKSQPILKGHTRSVQTAYTNSTPHNDYISPQSGTFQGDPQASTLFLFCQHLTLMLVEKYGGPGFPLPHTPLPPGCEGPLPPPLPVKVLSYADDTKPIDTTLKGVMQSMSMATLGQSIQGLRNNGSKALLTIPPGVEIPSPPPSILALDAYGTFGPHFPTLLSHTKGFRFLGHRLQQCPAPDPLNSNHNLPGSHHSEILAMHLSSIRSFQFIATSRNSSTKQLIEAARANFIPMITGIQQHGPPLPTIIEEADEALTRLAANSIDLPLHDSSLKTLAQTVCSPADQGGLGLPSLRSSIIHRQSNLIQSKDTAIRQCFGMHYVVFFDLG
jgi:hypothetical protein